MRRNNNRTVHASPQQSRTSEEIQIAVLGLGYVGLSLAVAFGRNYPTIGFDINHVRAEELRDGLDRNGDVTKGDLDQTDLNITSDPAMLTDVNFFVIAVPTPVDSSRQPDLRYLENASKIVGDALKTGRRRLDQKYEQSNNQPTAEQPNPIIVYESTVYPGCIEEVCIPLLEQESGLKNASQFHVAYSPERINPGDTEHRLETIVKVVAAQDPKIVEKVCQIYRPVAKAGLYQAPDIKTAEAAKVIENIQRDINIALMNELAIVFRRLGIDTREVLKAAASKWNFLPFEPGLVGGECIPVNPYYLTYKAEQVGYHPEVILSGRRINDSMGEYAAEQAIILLEQIGKPAKNASVLILGIAFKENVPDLRGSKVIDLARILESNGCVVTVCDPIVGSDKIELLNLSSETYPLPQGARFDVLVLAVPHKIFLDAPIDEYLSLIDFDQGPGILMDVKGLWKQSVDSAQKLVYWSL